MSKPLDGVKVDIGGREFIVPPMSIGAFKRTKADRATLDDAKRSMDDQMEAACRVIHASLVRNYPDLAIDDIEELVNFRNLKTVLPGIVAAWSADGDSQPGKEAAENPST